MNEWERGGGDREERRGKEGGVKKIMREDRKFGSLNMK